MTVYIEKPAFNLREELASLRNQGGYQEQQFYFDSLVTNGDFATNDLTGWTNTSTGTGSADASTGVLLLTTVDDSNAGAIVQELTTVAGAQYVISFEAARSAGSANLLLDVGTSSGGAQILNADAITTDGLYTYTFTAETTSSWIEFIAGSAGATWDIDNISVFEVDANDDVIHTMPKGWKPKDFFEDGLLQREGAANDYEVVYDGFDYFVKPTVAPSATTQTCVIGVKA